jgi:hypothetical protein
MKKTNRLIALRKAGVRYVDISKEMHTTENSIK